MNQKNVSISSLFLKKLVSYNEFVVIPVNSTNYCIPFGFSRKNTKIKHQTS